MAPSRRDLLASASVLATTALAGCNSSNGGSDDPTATDGTDAPETEGPNGPAEGATANAAVAAEWNAMRARAWDAVSAGAAGADGAGADLARQTFERFEGASGAYGAHEMLEGTSETAYAEFEEALGELRSEGLAVGDVARAREEAGIASAQLASAQADLVDEGTTHALDVHLLGTSVGNAAFLAGAEAFDAAQTVAENALARFEAAAAHDALESADAEAYEAVESGVESVVAAAESGDAEGVRSAATDTFDAAVDGGYALAATERAAAASHVAALQARGWDAAAAARLGGPSTDYAHAVTLTTYRARVQDARRLAAAGETDRAATMVGDVFAHFEGARAHEALESADSEAYEGFEAGLSALQSAIEDGDGAAADEALADVDANLVTGVAALAEGAAPLLEAGFFRARLADAREQYRRGEGDAAAAVAERVFGRFERDELGLHEAIESTSEDLYVAFEETHLSGLQTAFAEGDDEAVATHYDGAQTALLDYETAAGGVAAVSGAEASYVAARGFDAATLAALDDRDRAAAVAEETFGHFESGAGGYHEAMEEADESVYETFESELSAIGDAAEAGEPVDPAAKRFGAAAIESAYAIVAAAGGSSDGAAEAVLQDLFAHFESARVHDLVESTDRSAYESFEARLEAYQSALADGGDVAAAASAFADACLYVQFSLVDAAEDVPLNLSVAGTTEGGDDEESALQGGPNVVEGVPEDADHVVDMEAVSFAPVELTVSAGDTVAWTHAAGEAHTVTAVPDGIPEDATYWASGGFESRSAAEDGWANGEGAVQSGRSYVHTFETTGTHEYVCIPHEGAGMTGTVIVE